MIEGSIQADKNQGNQGDDTINGGEGKDTMKGGRGADTFMVSNGDVIKDFDPSQGDRIVLPKRFETDKLKFKLKQIDDDLLVEIKSGDSDLSITLNNTIKSEFKSQLSAIVGSKLLQGN